MQTSENSGDEAAKVAERPALGVTAKSRIESATHASTLDVDSEVYNKGTLPQKCYTLSNEGKAFAFESEWDFREDASKLHGLSILFLGDSNDNWLVKELKAEE